MSAQISLPAITRPRRRAELLPRKRLIDQLYDMLECKLILVVAPGGYGKTSLLIDFAHQPDIDACWYAIDQTDREIDRFLAHFLAAIHKRYPAFGPVSQAALQTFSRSTDGIEDLVITIVNELYEQIREHFVLVLDDFHLVQSDELIAAFVGRFIQRVDEHCHLIIASREHFRFEKSQHLFMKGLGGVLDHSDLAFTPEEIEELTTRQSHPINREEATRLAEETEGWITGILLTRSQAGRLPGIRSAGLNQSDYWSSVIGEQPADVRAFLLFTSHFGQFNLSLCQQALTSQVTGQTLDWPALFHAVQQRNLYVLAAGDDGTWLRYHHLFQAYLQSRLAKEFPAARKKILRRQIEILAEQQDWHHAFALAHELGDHELTASVIEQSGPTLIKTGQDNTLKAWLDSLPYTLTSTHPGMLALRGTISISGRDLSGSISLLSKAADAYRAAGDRTRLAHTLNRRSVNLYLAGDYHAALSDAEESVSLTEGDEKQLAHLAQALKDRGVALHRLNRTAEGIRDLKASLDILLALDDVSNVALNYKELGILYRTAGDWEAANDAYQQSLQFWRANGNHLRLADLLNNYGVFLHGLGKFEEAASILDEGLIHARKVNFKRLEAFLLASLGDIYSDLLATDDARHVYEESQVLAERTNNRFLQLYVMLGLSGLQRRLGYFAQAHSLVASAQNIAEPDSGYESGLISLESGRIALTEGNLALAQEHLNTAVRHFDEGHHSSDESLARLYLAAVLFKSANQPAAKQQALLALEQKRTLQPHGAGLIADLTYIQPMLAHFAQDTQAGYPAARLLQQLEYLHGILPSLRRKLRKATIEAVPVRPTIALRAFGGASLAINHTTYDTADWKSPTQREIIFYLLHHPEGASKQRLLEIFWSDEHSGANQLANMLYKMRRAFGEDLVLYSNERYYFNRSLDYEYDVDQFDHDWEQARQTASPAMRAELLARMMSLYKGIFLPESEHIWVMAEQERLRRIYLEAAAGLARYHLETGAATASLQLCWRIFEQDQHSDELYRLAMRAARAVGDRTSLQQVQQMYRQISSRLYQTDTPPDDASHLRPNVN